jgi:hypothetical protein
MQTYEVEMQGKYGAGKKMIVDFDDKDHFVNKKCCVDAQGYPRIWKQNKSQCVQRFLMGVMNHDTKEVSYINDDKMDNRKCNLRVSEKGTGIKGKRDRTNHIPTNYQNGRIYKISHTNGPDFYTGSTCNQLCQRLANHRDNSIKSPHIKLYKFVHDNRGWNNFTIEKIEDFPCSSKEELLQREQYWKDTLKPTLNTMNCIFDNDSYKKIRNERDRMKRIQKRQQKETVKQDIDFTVCLF